MQNNQKQQQPQQNNNNKGESDLSIRRGKNSNVSNNNESKAQTARNKHKNSQNKEKHGNNSRTSSRSDSNASSNGATQQVVQVNGQVKDMTVSSNSTIIETSPGELVQKSSTKLRAEQSQQQTGQNSKGTKLVQQIQDLKINGILQNGTEHIHVENNDIVIDSQREGSTPASTISGSEDSNAINHSDRLIESSEESNSAVLLGWCNFLSI